MQCGIHLFFGFLISCLLCHPQAKYGCVFGSILPDIDLLFAVIAVAITGDADQADVYHRTATHSIVSAVLICAIIYGLSQKLENVVAARPKISHLLNIRAHPKTVHSFDARQFSTGFFIGLLSHALLDILYQKGVPLLWPLSSYYYGPFWTKMEAQSQRHIMLIEATDHYTDIFLFIMPMLVLGHRAKIFTFECDPEYQAAQSTGKQE